MRNYMKSELYRILHTKEMYLITGALVVITVLYHILTFLSKGLAPRYATTSFSYSCLVANPMLFACAGTVITYFLYEGNRRNGNIKNAAACGISRVKIFAGQCLISLAASTCAMLLTLTAWILSAGLLLPKTGPVHLTHLLSEIPAIYLISAACLVCALVCISYFEKTITGILVWGLIWFLIPKIFLIGGMRSEVLYQAALWLPSNLFTVVNGLYVNTRECITAWDTVGGMLRCIASGGIGTLVFVLSGILLLKNKDLA